MLNLPFGYSLRLPLSLLVLVGLMPAYAGMRPQTPEPVRVDLGEDRMLPGFAVTVPCFLSGPAEVEVGRIEMEITFPHGQVTFEHVRRGLISDQIKAEITTEVRISEADPALSVIKLSLTAGEATPIFPGFLFDLVFKIDPNVPMDSPPILLGNQSRAYTFSDSPEAVENVESQDGFILAVSEAPPVVSCFFYMH
ncbi:MAG: hypothetical protein IH937_10835 [Acidobacteria bacterium]|nr:hypothetical protein [Acidobacteriota bacterium]